MLRERFAFLRQAPVNGAPVDSEVLCDDFDAAHPGAEQADHEPPHLCRELVGTLLGIGVEHLAREAREPWVGIGIRDLEIPARTDDAVERVTELDPAPEQPVVVGAIGGRIVRETDAQRPPLRAHERLQHSKHDADCELRRLAQRSGSAEDQVFTQYDDVGALLEREVERSVQPIRVVCARFEREPQSRLLAHQ